METCQVWISCIYGLTGPGVANDPDFTPCFHPSGQKNPPLEPPGRSRFLILFQILSGKLKTLTGLMESFKPCFRYSAPDPLSGLFWKTCAGIISPLRSFSLYPTLYCLSSACRNKRLQVRFFPHDPWYPRLFRTCRVHGSNVPVS